jgi:hypothetical protein
VRETRARKIRKNGDHSRNNGKALELFLRAIDGIPDPDSVEESFLDDLPPAKRDKIRRTLKLAENKIMALHDIFKN